MIKKVVEATLRYIYIYILWPTHDEISNLLISQLMISYDLENHPEAQ